MRSEQFPQPKMLFSFLLSFSNEYTGEFSEGSRHDILLMASVCAFVLCFKHLSLLISIHISIAKMHRNGNSLGSSVMLGVTGVLRPKCVPLALEAALP